MDNDKNLFQIVGAGAGQARENDDLQCASKFTENCSQNIKKNGRELRKQLIIEAASKLMSIEKQKSISMRDIADELGIATSSIYTYFESQKELSQEIFLYNLERIDSIMDKNIDLIISVTENVTMDRFANFVNNLLLHEVVLQTIIFFITERKIPEKVRNKTTYIWKKMNDHVARYLKYIGISAPDDTATHAVLALMIGVIVLFSDTPSKTIDASEVSKTDIINTLIGSLLLAN